MKIDYMDKKDCCGCRTCEQICPKQAISMVKDKTGYSYPVIDKSICIECNLCEKACGFDEAVLLSRNRNNQNYYWVKNKNTSERMRSRSGGFFFLIAKEFIENGGVVYGSIIDENNYVKHIRGISIDDCIKMQGSKYVESDITDIYSMVKDDLKSGIKVLFTGTACQVSGLYGFLQKGFSVDNLITVDIVCHGVCSPVIYDDYIKFWERKKKGKIEKFDFRDKAKYGWEPSVESFVINGKRIYRNYYSRLFYSHNAMRPSCSNCKFAKVERIGDFSLADFWGVKKFYPEINDDKGVSSIFVNTEKAKDIFLSLTSVMEYGQISEENIMQPNLIRPTPTGKAADIFWEEYEKKGFVFILRKYGTYDLKHRLAWLLKIKR